MGCCDSRPEEDTTAKPVDDENGPEYSVSRKQMPCTKCSKNFFVDPSIRADNPDAALCPSCLKKKKKDDRKA